MINEDHHEHRRKWRRKWQSAKQGPQGTREQGFIAKARISWIQSLRRKDNLMVFFLVLVSSHNNSHSLIIKLVTILLPHFPQSPPFFSPGNQNAWTLQTKPCHAFGNILGFPPRRFFHGTMIHDPLIQAHSVWCLSAASGPLQLELVPK